MPTTLNLSLTIKLDTDIDAAAIQRAEQVFAEQLAPIVSRELLTGSDRARSFGVRKAENSTPAEIRRSQAWGYGVAFVKTVELRPHAQTVYVVLRQLDSLLGAPEADVFDSLEAAEDHHRRVGGDLDGGWTDSVSPVLSEAVWSESFAEPDTAEEDA